MSRSLTQLDCNLAYAQINKLVVVVHTKFGAFTGTVDALASDAVTLVSQRYPFLQYKTIALHAIHVIEYDDVTVSEPQNELAGEGELVTA